MRRKKAEELGAAAVCNPLETKVSSWIKEVTSGRGVDVAVESVGVEASLKDCLASVRDKGKSSCRGSSPNAYPCTCSVLSPARRR